MEVQLRKQSQWNKEEESGPRAAILNQLQPNLKVLAKIRINEKSKQKKNKHSPIWCKIW